VSGASKKWASIVVQQKPSRAIGSDPSRPKLQHGYIRHEEDGSHLYCTDSYILARIRIMMECEPSDRSSVLPEAALPRETLLALDEGSGFQFVDGCIQLRGSETLYPALLGAAAPLDFAQIFSEAQIKRSADIKAIAFGVRNLVRLTEALGTDAHSVRLDFKGQNKPITVTPQMDSCGRGLLMPVRSL